MQPRTLQAYTRTYRTRIEPAFGQTLLVDLSPRMIAHWRTELLADGVSFESTRKALTLLQAVATVAVEWGELSTNPVRAVRKPRQTRRPAVSPPTPDDVEAIRATMLQAGQAEAATMVSILAYAGLRPGEMLALRARHVRERTLLVEQAVSDGRLKVQKTGRNSRSVDLFGVLAEDLCAWTSVAAVHGDALLFARGDGDPWRTNDWDNWRNRVFHSATAPNGLARPRPYDLRHSFASLLIREQSASVVDIADQLGHAPTMTLDTYGHVMREHRSAPPIGVERWIRQARLDATKALRSVAERSARSE